MGLTATQDVRDLGKIVSLIKIRPYILVTLQLFTPTEKQVTREEIHKIQSKSYVGPVNPSCDLANFIFRNCQCQCKILLCIVPIGTTGTPNKRCFLLFQICKMV